MRSLQAALQPRQLSASGSSSDHAPLLQKRQVRKPGEGEGKSDSLPDQGAQKEGERKSAAKETKGFSFAKAIGAKPKDKESSRPQESKEATARPQNVGSGIAVKKDSQSEVPQKKAEMSDPMIPERAPDPRVPPNPLRAKDPDSTETHAQRHKVHEAYLQRFREDPSAFDLLQTDAQHQAVRTGQTEFSAQKKVV